MNIINEKEYENIPMVFNTIENSFRNIMIWGGNKTAECIYSYLKQNQSIVVTKISDEPCILKNGVEIVIYTEKVHPVLRNESDQEVYYIEFVDGEKFDILNCTNDIYKNLVPKFNEAGVRLVVLKSPDLRLYNRKVLLYGSMLFWRFISKYSKNRDHYLLHHLRCADQEQEFMQTKADKLPGYVRVHGNGNFINYDDGFRRVPSELFIMDEKPCIYLFGFCISANPMLKDTETIGARLQRYCGDKYRVVIKSNDQAAINLIMRECIFKDGDIVILFGSHHDTIPVEVEQIEMTEVYCQISQLWKHLTDSSFHIDAILADKIAKYVYKNIVRVQSQKTRNHKTQLAFGPEVKRAALINMYQNDSLVEYCQNYLSRYLRGGTNGCIVMNCNPFTLGHKKLIETASKQVDWLYIFVVSEDKSVFKYEDRFEMVKSGTKEFENVLVLKSSNYMISASTLPGYFDKNHLGNVKVSAKDDLKLFVSIAPILNIKIRFAGTEPKDPFTNGYNKEMHNFLPQYGISFMEIERFSGKDGNVISATQVREMIRVSNVSRLRELLPETTMKIIMGKYL